MCKKPSRLLLKTASKLFADPSERGQFVASLTNPNPPPPHIVWLKPKPRTLGGEAYLVKRISWKKTLHASRFTLHTEPVIGHALFDVEVLPPDSHPGKDPLHEQGFYYCMDPSSISAVSVISCIPPPLMGGGGGEGGVFIDLCSSPGGKGILAWHRFKPALSIFNEVSRKRMSPLIYNLKRCLPLPPSPLTGEGRVRVEGAGIFVTQMDPQKLSEKIPSSVSLVLVDAPCTGQSLLARGESAPGCFHPVLIKKCSGRQRRIIACAAKLVAPGGYLAYMTCTFSREENEDVVEWFLKKNTAFTPVAVPSFSPFQSHLSKIPCYRFWPHRGAGSGSFTVLLRKANEGRFGELDLDNLRTVWRTGL